MKFFSINTRTKGSKQSKCTSFFLYGIALIFLSFNLNAQQQVISQRNDGMTELRVNGFKQVKEILQNLLPFIKFNP
jgi:hypothetical protein